jgi:mono/diheme cytochrome c family protein
MRSAWQLAIVPLVLSACSPRARQTHTTWTAPGDSYELRLGKDVYQHYCQTCHGETGAGDGFNAFNLDPRPRDLSAPIFQGKSDAELVDAIRRGGAGVGLSPLMPPWGRTLTARQIEDVILFLRTLRRPEASPPAGHAGG